MAKSTTKESKKAKVAEPLSTVKAGKVSKSSKKEVAKPAKKVTKEKDSKKSKKKVESSSESESESESEASASDSDSSSSSEEKPAPKKATKAKAAPVKKAESSDSSDSESDSKSDSSDSDSDSESEEEKPAAKAVKTNGTAKAAPAKKAESSDSDSDSDSESEEEKPAAKAEKKAASSDDSDDSDDSDNDSDDSDSSDSDEEAGAKVEKTEEPSKKRKAEDDGDADAKKAKSDEPTTLFAGSLSWSIDDNALYEAFKHIEGLANARVMTEKGTGRSRGFGYVDFNDAASCTKAYETMNGTELEGRAINLDYANARPAEANPAARAADRAQRHGDTVSPESDTLFVGNLPFDVDQDSVRAFFEEVAAVASVRLPTDPDSGNLKGFGYVSFSSVEEAKQVFEAKNGAPIGNGRMSRAVRLDYASSKPQQGDTTWASEGFVDGSLGRGSLCLCRHCGVDQVGSCEYSEGPGGFSKHDHYDAIACPQASTGDDLLPLMSRPP
uniref:WGS project CBMD000000000 data, contig CS3427_c000125 n=2 Tax=Fusarium pseudograminearum TaxID=101028 RepID=A0A096PBG2_FUSPS|nr:unnamed protein product [Fusarium pseudograminearum CS3427]CEG02619.1 unnamed protein product [Fusarium pseudograminearum CS3487]